jgi:hypothetical protein
MLFRGDCNGAKHSPIQYQPGEKGCWRIASGDFINTLGGDIPDALTSEFIIEVHIPFPFLQTFTSNTSSQRIWHQYETSKSVNWDSALPDSKPNKNRSFGGSGGKGH